MFRQKYGLHSMPAVAGCVEQLNERITRGVKAVNYYVQSITLDGVRKDLNDFCGLLRSDISIDSLTITCDQKDADEVFILIAEALLHNTSLKELNLSCLKITEKSIDALYFLLEKNSTIESLLLYDMKIGDFLKFNFLENSSLKHLSLRNTEMSWQVSEQLVKSLEANCKLEYLDLSGTHIGVQATAKLLIALKDNLNLKYLDLSSNYLSFGRRPNELSLNDSLLEFMKFNETLKYFNLSRNSFWKLSLVTIAQMIKWNNSITDFIVATPGSGKIDYEVTTITKPFLEKNLQNAIKKVIGETLKKVFKDKLPPEISFHIGGFSLGLDDLKNISLVNRAAANLTFFNEANSDVEENFEPPAKRSRHM